MTAEGDPPEARTPDPTETVAYIEALVTELSDLAAAARERDLAAALALVALQARTRRRGGEG
jgi:hypothetical protein